MYPEKVGTAMPDKTTKLVSFIVLANEKNSNILQALAELSDSVNRLHKKADRFNPDAFWKNHPPKEMPEKPSPLAAEEPNGTLYELYKITDTQQVIIKVIDNLVAEVSKTAEFFEEHI